MAMYDIEGKVVCITGNDEVGYGSENKSIKGRVLKIETREDADVYALGYDRQKNSGTYALAAATKTTLGIDGDYVVTVEWGMTFENVPITATTAKQPVAGDFVLCDGAGALVKVPTSDGGVPTAYVQSVNTTAKTATITIM